MIGDDKFLDVIAGPIDAPAAWRHQFWIDPTFGSFTVAMFENDGKGTAAYLWVIPPAKAGGISLGDNPFSSESFDLQLACEIPNSISNHWQNWPFANVGEIDEGEVWHYFHGVRIYMRSFDGVTS
ncbi:MAG: hypothetical protein EOP04_26210, partial [Proteobacteria bacterium]